MAVDKLTYPSKDNAVQEKINEIIDDYVDLSSAQNITGVKTFVGQKMIAFKQSSSSNKLGFTLYNNSGTEKGYLEFNPTNTVDSVPLMTLGNYASASAGLTHVGFRKYSSISGASGAYNLLAPLISDARTPFSLTTTYTNFYLPLGFTNGTTTVLTAKSGLVDISSLFPSTPNLGDLGNVTITSPTQGQNLTYDATNNVWKNTSTSATVAWGGITGDLADQTDLSTALGNKQDTSTAVTHTASTAVGNSTTPVYVDSSGVATALSYTIETSVPSGAVFTDTLNTAGSTDTSSKIFLVGATSQAANPQTYSHDTVFVDTNGRLNSAAPASAANDTTVATTKWVKDQGYTTNTGTVTSVNNVAPVSGNVTLTIPTTTDSITSGSAAALTSGGAYTNVVTSVAAHSTDSDKIVVTKAGSTSTITINDVSHATSADSATSATTASNLGSSDVGSTTQPIFLDNGVATACTYSLEKSVPSNAVFTDTTYSDFTGATSIAGGAHGLVPAPSAGDEGKFLKGDGTWDTVGGGGTTEIFIATYEITSYADVLSAYNAGKYIYVKDGDSSYYFESFTSDGFKFVSPISENSGSGIFGIILRTDNTWTSNGHHNLQNKLSAGSNITISGDTISATDTTYTAFTGCDSITAGTSGLVPAPSAGDEGKFLKGDGTWGTVSSGSSSLSGLSDVTITSASSGQALCYNGSAWVNAPKTLVTIRRWS